MERRRFLLVCTTAVAGLWLRPTGLTTLSKSVVLALGGTCSFCGDSVPASGALAGGIGAPVRICRGCISLCLDILAEDDDIDVLAAAGRRMDRAPRVEADDLLGDILATNRLAGKDLEGAIDALRARLDGDSQKVAPSMACSFCAAPHEEVHKLVAGPKVYICDACIGDATVVLGTLIA